MSLVIPYHKEEVFEFTEQAQRFDSTNFSVVNRTDYSSRPSFNFFWSMVHGDLQEEGVTKRKLCDFFDLIAEPKLTNLWYDLKVTGKRMIVDRLTMKGEELEGKLDAVLVRITNNPLMRFNIDPRSYFRVERRGSEGESRLYDVALKLDVYEQDKVSEKHHIFLRAKLNKQV